MPDMQGAALVPAWPWWLGGLVIGLMVPLMYILHNTALGASTGYGSLIKLLRPQTRLSWIRASFKHRWDWRIFFMFGIVLGAFVSARMAGRPLTSTEMGIFTAMVDWPLHVKGAFFFLGGFLLAMGARLAGGCTSGHSIHGLANLHLSSLVATVFFLVCGVMSTALVRTVLFGDGR